MQTLPPRLRTRVVALAAQALGRVPHVHVPAALRKSASFAPAKRARLVGAHVSAALDSDDDFRAHLATHVRVSHSGVVRRLESADCIGADVATATEDAEALAEAAAVAYVVRPAGWLALVARASAAEFAQQVDVGALEASLERRTAELAAAKAETRTLRDKLRERVDDAKSENATLRRTLGSTRQQLRASQQEAAAAAAELVQAHQAAEASRRVSAAEVRRLRARIDQLESQTTSIRRTVRAEREAETTRLRLLLDTIMEGAAGLRRELALPPSDLLPAETVRAIIPDVDGGLASAGRTVPGDDPVLLRRLLDLPRVHLVVDGYNVSKSAWPSAALEDQRNRLVTRVAALVAGKAVEVTVVYDGADLDRPPKVGAPRGIRVLFSPPGVIADDTIRQLVSAEPVGRPLVVVSTDRELSESVTKMGARSVTSQAMIEAIGG